jgi:hypothetical protein
VPFLAFVAMLAGSLAAGWVLAPAFTGPRDSAGFRAVLHLTAGTLLIHGVLAWLDLGGLPWYAPVVAAIVAVVAILGRRFLVRRAPLTPAAPAPGLALGWAGVAAGAIVAFFAILALSQRIAFPDFIYHWGIKGHRYFLGRGIDYDFLSREWNLVAHRDYPQLVPELYALQSLIAGRFAEPWLLVWSAVWFAALLIAAREALDAWRVPAGLGRTVFALLALAIGVFAVGHLMAGSVDWIVAIALTAALPALVRPVSARGELQIGLMAALAAATKLEGLPLAALLVGAGVWRRLRGRSSLAGEPPAEEAGSPAGAAARLLLPSAIAVVPWLVQGLRHDLFRDPQSGAFEIGRAPAIAASVWEAMLRPEWHFASLVLLLLPLLFVRRETRLAGAVIALQLAGYLLRYFTASFDFRFSVLSSFPRLIFHVLPAVVVGLAAVAAAWRARAPVAREASFRTPVV